MKTSHLILGAALGAGALWLYRRTLDRALSGTGQGTVRPPPRNDAAGPRLPGMPEMPSLPGMPPMPRMPDSWAAPNAPSGGGIGPANGWGNGGVYEPPSHRISPIERRPAEVPMSLGAGREFAGWVQ